MLYFDEILLYIKEFINCIGVFVITFGAFRAVYHLYYRIFHNTVTTNYIRLSFGSSVILGLEFMVGADIVGSLVKPDYYNLGLIAILVVIRTILSYFLNLELKSLTPAQHEAVSK
ncbi:MAG TPA: DUF1622 domain-containing protein [Candidatus Babeliales bacterium]|nr:DUF1622 domain-containing protein [Candidatus Babeliales bacterium]